MSILLDYSEALRALLDMGAIAAVLSDSSGVELGFLGNDSYKDILKACASFLPWILDKANSEFVIEFKARYNINCQLMGIDRFVGVFSISDSLRCYVYRESDMQIACIIPKEKEIALNVFGDVVVYVKSMLEKGGEVDDTKALIEKLKDLILQARKSVSYGDKQMLLQNLNEIKKVLVSLNDPLMMRYVELVDNLIKFLGSSRIENKVELKIKRSLLTIFRGITKRVEGQI